MNVLFPGTQEIQKVHAQLFAGLADAYRSIEQTLRMCFSPRQRFVDHDLILTCAVEQVGLNLGQALKVLLPDGVFFTLSNMNHAVGTTKFTWYTGGLLQTEDGPRADDTVTHTYSNRLRTHLGLAQPASYWSNAFSYDVPREIISKQV